MGGPGSDLPDEEGFKQSIDATVLHQTLAALDVPEPDMLNHGNEETLIRNPRGRPFTGTRRRGKFLFLHLDDGNWLFLPDGMMGEPEALKDPEDDTDHDRMLIEFENGYHLAYDCTRKFGEINFTNAVRSVAEDRDRGFRQILQPSK